MTDQIIQTVLRYGVDQASVQSALQTNQQIDNGLKQISLSAVQLGRNGDSVQAVNARFAEMRARVAEVKVEAVELGDTARTLKDELDASANSDAIRELGGAFGYAAQQEGNAAEQAAQLAARLHEIGASEAEVRAAGAAFLDAQGGGAGGGLLSGVGQLGSRLRALPSVQIPGAGISTDSVANILRVVPAVEQLGEKIPIVTTAVSALTPIIGVSGAAFAGLLATVAVVAAPIIAVVAAIKLYTDTVEAQRKAVEDTVNALKSDTDARLEEVDIIRHASAVQIQDTIDTAKAKLAEVQLEKSFREQYLKGIQDQYAALGAAFDPARRAALGEAGQAAQQSIDDLTAREQQLTDVINENTNVILPAVQKREEETQKIQDQTAAAQKLVQVSIQAVNAQQQTEIQIAQLRQQGSLDQLNQAKTDNENQRAAIQDSIVSLTNLRDAYAVGSDEYKAYQEQIDNASNQIHVLEAAYAQLGDTALESAVKANDAAKERQKIRDDEIGAVKSYNEAIQSAKDKEAQAEIDLANKLADTQVSIAQKAADDSQKALDDLLDKEAQLQTNLTRSLDADTAKAQFDAIGRQIKFQRTEVENEQKHQADLERIRQQGRDKEFELGLSRDFAGLAASRRQTAQQLADSNQKANDDRQSRLDAFQQQNDDTQRQFIFEREQKIIKYQQDLDDANAAEQKQLNAIQAAKDKQLRAAVDAYNKDLSNLQTKLSAELDLKKSAITAELQQIAAGNAARLQLDAQYYQQAQTLLQSAISGVSGGAVAPVISGGGSGGHILPTPYALGGDVRAGQVISVNEPGSSGLEGFSTARGAIQFPGYGTFIPSTSGTVNSNNRALSVNMPITIQTGADQRAVQAIIPALRGMVEERISYAFDRYSGG